MGREKDIQYASRADTPHRAPAQIHRLRHVIRELREADPGVEAVDGGCRELEAYGCGTTMHIVRLLAPTLASEDFFKDIDFSPTASARAGRPGTAMPCR